MSFTPRLSEPTSFTTYYTERRIPAQPEGVPTYWQYFYSGDYTYRTEGAHTGNCTWYAMGRSAEIAERNLYSEFAGSYEAQNWGNIWNGNPAQTSGSVSWQPGDILIWSNNAGTFGHVEVVEIVSGNYLTISYSAYSGTDPQSENGTFFNTRRRSKPTWGDPASLTSESDSRFIRNSGAAYYLTNEFLIGVIHNPYYNPEPGPGTETPDVSITPTSAVLHLSASDSYADVTFDLEVTGIPDGESVSGGTTYAGLTRISNGTGWVYSTYVVDGVTYQRATKTGMILRYTREQTGSYTTTKYLIFDKTYANGRAYQSVPISIAVDAQTNIRRILAAFIRNRNKRRGMINVSQL